MRRINNNITTGINLSVWIIEVLALIVPLFEWGSKNTWLLYQAIACGLSPMMYVLAMHQELRLTTIEKINNFILWCKSATCFRVQPASENRDGIDCEGMEMGDASGAGDDIEGRDEGQGTFIRVQSEIENSDGIDNEGMELEHGSGDGDGNHHSDGNVGGDHGMYAGSGSAEGTPTRVQPATQNGTVIW